jgi:hypothetical protein
MKKRLFIKRFFAFDGDHTALSGGGDWTAGFVNPCQSVKPADHERLKKPTASPKSA